MKRSERHHLKENELALRVAAARRAFEEHRRTSVLATTVAVLIIGAAAGLYAWQQHTNRLAQTQLGAALAALEPPAAPTPETKTDDRKLLEQAVPKLLATADAYPKTSAGVAARYHAAATLAALGRFSEAEARYSEVIARAGDKDVYGQMARLGLAEVHAATRRVDQAIATYRELATRGDVRLPIDGILMQLGRLYARAGRSAEATQTFTKLLEQFPNSPYAGDARTERDALKSSS